MVMAAFVLAVLQAVPAAGAQPAQEPISFSIAENTSVETEVIDVNLAERTFTVKDEAGNVKTFKAEDTIRNLNQVYKGDKITVELSQHADVTVEKGPGETMNIGSETQTGSRLGEKPGGMRISEGKLKTRVESIDYDKKTVTYKNRNGKMTTYNLGKDAKRLNEVRRGDMLVIEYKQTVKISVK
jgi:hypothetical protein